MIDKPATLSAGQLAAEWDAKWKRLVADGWCKVDANLAGVYFIRGIEPCGGMFDAELDNGVLIRVTDTYEFTINWLNTPATAPQTDTPAGEGQVRTVYEQELEARNADLQRLIDRAIDVMYDTMGKDDLMDYADFIDTLRKAGKGGGEHVNG